MFQGPSLSGSHGAVTISEYKGIVATPELSKVYDNNTTLTL
jgi:hypothetical protein